MDFKCQAKINAEITPLLIPNMLVSDMAAPKTAATLDVLATHTASTGKAVHTGGRHHEDNASFFFEVLARRSRDFICRVCVAACIRRGWYCYRGRCAQCCGAGRDEWRGELSYQRRIVQLND